MRASRSVQVYPAVLLEPAIEPRRKRPVLALRRRSVLERQRWPLAYLSAYGHLRALPFERLEPVLVLEQASRLAITLIESDPSAQEATPVSFG